MKSMKSAIFAIPSLVTLSLAAAQAAPASPSGSANAGPPGVAVSAYAWPKETSDAPKDEEWAGATELEPGQSSGPSGWLTRNVRCRQRALRDWMRIDCDAPGHLNNDTDHFFGSIWGVAGEVSGASASFVSTSTLERFQKPLEPRDEGGRIMRRMGATASLTFQVKYGSASMFRIDEIFYAENYMGEGSVLLDPGLVVEVSWALGEKHPSLVYHW